MVVGSSELLSFQQLVQFILFTIFTEAVLWQIVPHFPSVLALL